VRVAFLVALAGAALSAAACASDSQNEAGLDSAFAEAESTYFRGAADSTELQLQALLAAADARGDARTAGRATVALAVVAYRKSEYPTLRRLGERALTMPLRPADRFRANNILGLAAYYESRYRDAVIHLDRAIEEARRNRDSLDLAKAIMNRGLVDVEFGDYVTARQRFVAARFGARRFADRRTEGKALTNLGMLETKAGAPLAAVAWLDTARAAYRLDAYWPGEVSALGHLGVAYAAMGEPQRALAALDSAVTLAHEHELPHEEASNLLLVAEQYQAAGDFPRALDYLARAQVLNTKLGLQDERGVALRDAAEIHLTLGQHVLARQRTTEAIAIHRTTESALEQLVDYLLLARIDDRARRRSDAESALRTARVLAERLSTPDARVRVAVTVADIADRAGRSRDVLEALDSAAADLALAAPAMEARVLTLRARAFARLDMLDSSVSTGRSALRAVERVRGRYVSGALRTSFMTGNIETYGDLVLVLLRQGFANEAFEVADAARGRGMLEHLAQARGDLASRTDAARELLETEALLDRIDKLMEQIRVRAAPRPHERAVAVDGNDAELSTQLERARNDYEAMLERSAARDAASRVLLGGRTVGSAAIRRALHPNEVLVEYFIADDQLLAFVVTPDTIRVVSTRVAAADLSSRVRVARELVARRDSSRGRVNAALESLYGTLIRPVRAVAAVGQAKRLVIVAHGPLAYLPFAALRDPADGRYLVEQYALLHMPSAAALAAVREAPAGAEAPSSAVAFAPFPDDLPATELEARGVARTVPGALAVAGSGATESALRRALDSAALVHVATHGQLNAHSPMFSHLTLAAGRRGDRRDDGRLEVHELLGMRVRSSLVFLSGCETGAGAAWTTAFSPGEDFATLAQAFLYAGAKSVVATLWRIEDGAAAAFAERFYVALHAMPAPEALAEAQRGMLRSARYAAPFDWAAYEVTGGDVRWPVLARR
jgi:CHAT domain-containing protein/tetratricopeptide (TPR) repeat protein